MIGSSGAIQRWYAYALVPYDVLSQMNVTRDALVPDIQGSIIAPQDSSSGAQPDGQNTLRFNLCDFALSDHRLHFRTHRIHWRANSDFWNNVNKLGAASRAT